ncbi:secreted protein [gut metagenome]|uniref:Secreted protein n=1 Tax=gut metagenome TaxID=749906 RepID=J9CWY9_9ZZZZ
MHIRHNYHAAGMLAGGTFYAGATYGQTIFLGTVDRTPSLLQIFFHITISRFVLQTGNRTCLKNEFLTEQFFGVPVYLTLILTREVQVYIRFLISFKAKEGFERYVVAVYNQLSAAFWTNLIRKVKPVGHTTIGNKFTVFAFRTKIVRWQAVYF